MKKEELVIKTEDHPEANGRKPIAGESCYTLRFPMEDGRELVLKMGKEGFEITTGLLMDLLTHAPEHNDGSTNE